MKDRILALTHFESVVTPEDFKSIAADTHKALQEATETFHILIDNRIIAEPTVASLDTMLQAMPVLQHPLLRWIVVVLPEAIKENAASMEDQQQGAIRLKYVDSLAAALRHLANEDGGIDDGKLIHSLFFTRSTD
jgi:hypothetical protein